MQGFMLPIGSLLNVLGRSDAAFWSATAVGWVPTSCRKDQRRCYRVVWRGWEEERGKPAIGI
jgi:hypothetical protein